jgi:hypothetical protein
MFVSILICILIIGGCAGIPRITEPANEDSSLLVGRITITAEKFPSQWRIKGDYTDGIVMHLFNRNTIEIINVRSRGDDGLLYLLIDTPGRYAITGFTFKKKEGSTTSTLRYKTSDPHIIDIDAGTVNNLGDMHWIEKFESTTYKAGGKSRGKSSKELRFIENYDQVREWFQQTYPDSSWNKKNWINV